MRSLETCFTFSTFFTIFKRLFAKPFRCAKASSAAGLTSMEPAETSPDASLQVQLFGSKNVLLHLNINHKSAQTHEVCIRPKNRHTVAPSPSCILQIGTEVGQEFVIGTFCWKATCPCGDLVLFTVVWVEWKSFRKLGDCFCAQLQDCWLAQQFLGQPRHLSDSMAAIRRACKWLFLTLSEWAWARKWSCIRSWDWSCAPKGCM